MANLTEGAGAVAAGANPYGAALGAAAGVLNTALQDTPSNSTAGSGAFQSGPFVIGQKVIGKGRIEGSTSASAQQTQATNEPGAASSWFSPTNLIIIAVGAVALLLLAFKRKP